ncbi:putative transmembrane protein [Lysobacter dokdonensis DS-58]|uniref:Putative transmembrane protein n=1 Tax=Lysobacter dokdonensis DS-58 TaxID=1300345 RepID=A0A0A2WIC1_9GAMM|nr:hypothetical protein [Lysobacter dokdonensis]KGQ19538.1 putative transmembrane protein [Lysobacter dokdonensis DS-58]
MSTQGIAHSRWFGAALALVGSGGVAAAWVAVSMVTASQCGWMAVVAALDAAFLLRLARAPRGLARMAIGVGATILAVALAQWGIVSAHLSGMLGLGFADTMGKLGPSLAWTLTTLANSPADWAWIGAGLVVAAFASR